MTTGGKIKKYRELKSLTQSQLGNIVGISLNGLWNYENDKREIGIETLTRIASALDVTVTDLLKDNAENDKIREHVEINDVIRHVDNLESFIEDHDYISERLRRMLTKQTDLIRRMLIEIREDQV